jgi:histidinol-phosphate aminotransferase
MNHPVIKQPSPDQQWLAQFLEPSLLNAKVYKIDTPDCPVKLDQNESPFDWPSDLKKKVLDRVGAVAWNRYPSAYNDSLTASVARIAGVESDAVLLGPGSNYLIALVLSTFSRCIRGKTVIARPSFALYESHCHYDGIPFETWDLDENLQYDENKLPELPAGSMVVFASPNNPVGNVLKRETLSQLLQKHPNTLFFADEAYVEFADEPFTPLLAKFQNLILLRTFSKTMGAAGVRLGYLVGPKSLVAEIRKLRVPFIINQFASIAAETVLGDENIRQVFLKQVADAKAQREIVHTALSQVAASGEFELIPSQANFILARWKDTPTAITRYEALVKEGVLVRNVSGAPGLSGCLRISIGKPSENQTLIKAATKVWSGR